MQSSFDDVHRFLQDTNLAPETSADQVSIFNKQNYCNYAPRLSLYMHSGTEDTHETNEKVTKLYLYVLIRR